VSGEWASVAYQLGAHVAHGLLRVSDLEQTLICGVESTKPHVQQEQSAEEAMGELARMRPRRTQRSTTAHLVHDVGVVEQARAEFAVLIERRCTYSRTTHTRAHLEGRE